MKFKTITVVGGTPATLLVDYGETCTLVNSDMVHPVILGDARSIQPGDEETVPFPAGQTGVFREPTYAVTPSGVDVTVFKYPSVYSFASLSGQTPTALPPNVYSASAGDGNTVDLVGGSGFPNPNGLAILLVAANINGAAVANAPGNPSGSFLVEDMISDLLNTFNLKCEIGLAQGSGGQLSSTASLDTGQAYIPGIEGNKLQLVNGGGAGVTGLLRRCSATIVFYLTPNILPDGL